MGLLNIKVKPIPNATFSGNALIFSIIFSPFLNYFLIFQYFLIHYIVTNSFIKDGVQENGPIVEKPYSSVNVLYSLNTFFHNFVRLINTLTVLFTSKAYTKNNQFEKQVVQFLWGK